MGLDMYLEATRYVAPYDAQTEPMRRAIGAAIGYVPLKEKPGQDASLLEVSGVTVRVGYWRKHFTADIDETLDEDEVDYTLRILHHAKRLQAEGWDIYYRASW